MRTKKPSPVAASVMAQIRQGKVTMRPQAYFTLLFALSLAGIVFAGLVVSYLAGIVFFWVRIQTADTMAWGARTNLDHAVDAFPWWAIPLAATALALVVRLVRRQGTMYRHRTATVVVVVALLSLLMGIGMSYYGMGAIRHNGQSGTGSSQRYGPEERHDRWAR